MAVYTRISDIHRRSSHAIIEGTCGIVRKDTYPRSEISSEVEGFDQPFKTATKETEDQPDKFCEAIRDHPDCLFHDRERDQSPF